MKKKSGVHTHTGLARLKERMREAQSNGRTDEENIDSGEKKEKKNIVRGKRHIHTSTHHGRVNTVEFDA